MTEYLNKVDLLLTLAELPNEASKKDILRVVYEMPAKVEAKVEGAAYLPGPLWSKVWAENT